MNKTIIFSLVGTIGVFSLVYLNLDNDNIKDLTIKTPETVEEKSTVEKKKNIEILYLDEETQKKENNQPIETKSTDVVKSKDLTNNFESKQIKEYITKKQLKAVNINKNINKQANQPRAQKYTLYSNVTLEEAKTIEENNNGGMLPPMAPTIMKVQFSSGATQSIIVPSSIMSQSSELIVTKNDENGEPLESVAVKEDQVEATLEEREETPIDIIIAPPQIGQN